MTAGPAERIDSASRFIRASPQTIYQSYVDPAALASWLPPSGMQARIDEYDVRPGGRYRIVLTYEHSDAGSSSVVAEWA